MAGRPRAWAERIARIRRTPEVKVALLLACIVFGLSAIADQISAYSQARQHLGAEYYNIARALADGRGFSDPFAERTGPTAWMPPIYPGLLGALLILLQKRSLLAVAVVFLMNVTSVAMGTTLYAIARRGAVRLPPGVAVLLSATWIVVFNFWFIVMTTDVWILVLISTFLVLATFDCLTTRRIRPYAWGILGGVASLCSPTLGVAALFLFVFFAWRERQSFRKFLVAGAIAATLLMPWVVRNAVAFQQLVLVKSNLVFEVYQANFVDDDGIYDAHNMMNHPYNRLESRFRYAKFSEPGFIEGHRRVVKRTLPKEPERLLRNVKNRIWGTLSYPPLSVQAETELEMGVRRAVYATPFAIFWLAIWVRRPHRTLLLVLGGLCFAYLLPYVLVAFYIRYFLVMSPVLLAISFFGLDQLAARWLPAKTTSERSTELAPTAA